MKLMTASEARYGATTEASEDKPVEKKYQDMMDRCEARRLAREAARRMLEEKEAAK